MYIKCWGARGSVPVCGKGFLKYGGDTTCIEIRTEDGQIIIVDAGSGIRRLGAMLLENEEFEFNLLFTHAHWDHVLGFPFFGPIFHPETRIHLLGCPFAQKFVINMLDKVMSPPNFPVRYADINARIESSPKCPQRIEIGSVRITPIRLSHPNQGNGYRFSENGKHFVFLTDNELDFHHPGGLPREDYRKFAAGADLLIHDAEYTPDDYLRMKKWGHSVYTSALALAMDARVKRFGLFHHHQWKTDAEIDEMVADCRIRLRAKDVDMECFGVGADWSLTL